jgi:hypothetical protein
MKRLYVLAIMAIVLFAVACWSKEDKAAKAAAERVIDALTPERLSTFGQWTYSEKAGVWYKDSLGKPGSISRFAERNDSLILTVGRPAQFIQDFQLDIPVEARLSGLTLVKTADTCIFISEDALIGGYRWTTLDCSVDTIFKRGNPFTFFGDLTRFKDSLGIQGIEHPGGQAIEFYLVDGWVLTYLPEEVVAGLDKKRQEELKRGEMIEKEWNLRRNDEQTPMQ